jgi:hypothetical protein
MRGAISKSGGNTSLAEEGRRYGDVYTGAQAKAGYSQVERAIREAALHQSCLPNRSFEE